MSIPDDISASIPLVTAVALTLLVITCITLMRLNARDEVNMNMSTNNSNSNGNRAPSKQTKGQNTKFRSYPDYQGPQPMVRYVRVSTTSPPLVLGQVEVFVGKTNVAPINGAPRQSSTLDNNYRNHGPNLAINGDLSATGFGGGDAARTKPEDTHPWWEVDLGSEMPVNQVNLWLQDRGRFPNPYSAWYLNNDIAINVQLLCRRKKVKWHRWIHEWADVVPIPII